MKKLSSSNIIARIQRPNTICAVTKTYLFTLCPKDEYVKFDALAVATLD